MKRHCYFKGVFLVLITMIILSTACVYGAEESITVTTYYPSPYGVYSEMRLYPKSSPNPPCQEGTMYYDVDVGEKGLKVCDASGNPQSIGGNYDNLNWVGMTSTDNNNNLAGFLVVGAVPNGWTTAGIESWTQSIANTWGLRMVWNHFKMNPIVTPPTTDAVLGSGVATGTGYPGGVRSTNYIPKFYNPNYEANSQIYDNGTNIGIGTASPASSARLHVAGHIYTPNSLKAGNLGVLDSAFGPWGITSNKGVLAIGYDNGFAAGIGQNAGGETGMGISSTGPAQAGAFYINPTVNELRLKAYNGRSFNFITSAGVVPDFSRLFIRNNDGFIGIGTTTPWARIDVTGTLVNIPGFRTLNSTNNRSIFMVPELGPGGYNWLSQNGDSGIFFSNLGAGLVIGPWAGGSYGMRMTASGYVGIGTPTPGYTLTVVGSAWCSSLWSTSDIRWKKNIKPLENSLSKLLSLRGVNFEWKKEEYPDMKFSDGTQIGFIAQDIEKIIPEVVTTDNKGYKGISYEKLVPVLTEAIKEQQAKIESLEARIETLEKR